MATPPQNPMPNPQQAQNAQNLAQGTLLGTAAFQRTIDQLERFLTDLTNKVSRQTGLGTTGMGAASLGLPTAGAGGLHGTQSTMSSGASQQAQLAAWQRVSPTPTMKQQFLNGLSPTLFGGSFRTGNWRGMGARLAGMGARSGLDLGGGLVSGYGSGLGGFATAADAYARQAMLWQNSFGLSGGTLAQSYAGRLMRFGGQYWGQGAADMFSAGLTITQQAGAQNAGRLLNAASTTAMLNPGMSLSQVAQMQAKFTGAQGFYAQQMFGITPTRAPGGVIRDPLQTVLSLANRVNANIGGFGALSQQGFTAEMMQGGSLSTSLANFGRAQGMSGMEQQAMANQLAAVNTLVANGKMSPDQAVKLLNTFSASPTSAAGKAAYAQMKSAGLSIADTLSGAQNILQGRQANGYLGATADYLDAARTTANTLQDIYDLLNKVLTPFAGLAGAYASGGVLGAVGNMFGLGTKAPNAGSSVQSSEPAAVRASQARYAQSYAAQQKSIASKYGHSSMPTRGGGASSASGGGQGGSGSVDGSGSPAANASAALGFAQKQLGDPYVWGGTGPNVWDCSGLTQAAWAAAGVKLPRTSEEQSNVGIMMSLDQAGPGDLIFYGSPGSAPHVGIVSGPDQVLEAPHTGDVVKYERISADPNWKFARRVSGGLGAATSNLSGGTPGNAANKQSGIGSGGSVLGGEEVDILSAILGGKGSGVSWGSAAGDSSGSQTQQAANTASTSGAGGGVNTNGYSSSAKDAVALGQQMAAAYGWTGSEWTALFKLWNQESSWNANAVNPSSGAYGIPQALGHGHPYNLGDAKAQIAWGLDYIKGRYGDPATAWAHEVAQGWYSGGISEVVGDKLAMLHDGEMVLTANQARDARRRAAAGAPNAGGNVTIHMGGVTIQMASASTSEAQSAAKTFVDFVAADDRIKTLMGGW
jgi:cell wall-associated NlpC family hydrolase